MLSYINSLLEICFRICIQSYWAWMNYVVNLLYYIYKKYMGWVAVINTRQQSSVLPTFESEKWVILWYKRMLTQHNVEIDIQLASFSIRTVIYLH